MGQLTMVIWTSNLPLVSFFVTFFTEHLMHLHQTCILDDLHDFVCFFFQFVVYNMSVIFTFGATILTDVILLFKRSKPLTLIYRTNISFFSRLLPPPRPARKIQVRVIVELNFCLFFQRSFVLRSDIRITKTVVG